MGQTLLKNLDKNLPPQAGAAEQSEVLENKNMDQEQGNELANDERKGKLKGALETARKVTGKVGNELLRQTLKFVKDEGKSTPASGGKSIIEEASSSEASSSSEETSVSNEKERIDFKDGDDSAIVFYRKTKVTSSGTSLDTCIYTINNSDTLESAYIIARQSNARNHEYSNLSGSEDETEETSSQSEEI